MRIFIAILSILILNDLLNAQTTIRHTVAGQQYDITYEHRHRFLRQQHWTPTMLMMNSLVA